MHGEQRGSPRQVLERLDKLVQAGRVSEEEAERLRQAAGTNQFAEIVREFRLAHVSERLDEAVSHGQLPEDEAAVILERLESGEPPKFLPRFLRRRHREYRMGASPSAGRRQQAS